MAIHFFLELLADFVVIVIFIHVADHDFVIVLWPVAFLEFDRMLLELVINYGNAVSRFFHLHVLVFTGCHIGKQIDEKALVGIYARCLQIRNTIDRQRPQILDFDFATDKITRLAAAHLLGFFHFYQVIKNHLVNDNMFLLSRQLPEVQIIFRQPLAIRQASRHNGAVIQSLDIVFEFHFQIDVRIARKHILEILVSLILLVVLDRYLLADNGDIVLIRRGEFIIGNVQNTESHADGISDEHG